MTTKEADMRADEFPQDLYSLDIDSLEIVSSKESASQKAKTDLVSLFNMPSSQSLQPPHSLDLELTMMDHSDMLLDAGGIEAPDLTSDLSLGSILNSVTSAGFTACTDASTLSLSDLPMFVADSSSAQFCATPTYSYTSESNPTTPGYLTPAPSPNSSYPSSPRGGIILSKNEYSSGTTTPTGGRGGAKAKIPRHKRQSHIRAEYKRRSKIQGGFDEIKALIPSIQESSGGNSSKESKSNMLNKTVDYCRQLKAENKALLRESCQLRAEIEGMTADIKSFQENMPDAGLKTPSSAPPSPVSAEKQLEDYLHARTVSNWKFWIFGLFARSLFESYNRSVETNNVEDFFSSVLGWVEEHLSLRNLRPAVFNTLRHVSSNTSIIGDPSRLPEEALKAALSSSNQQPVSLL
ncbi:hypothetical protein CAPTEDRAFT_221598 [Capitella teleta]|uniref:BHLH domain-containing protein n=1 Tax=Capitella teleta TaxID=283909 RepID=R7UY00_CAPTE|nr:hypothetical protein CAPTEDRAFT_221598 [Capitella teleta]|eukprot:ELU11458.1 hypothetical protein CAPTEDRAFT_221598 [Capitella teleta]